MGEEDATVRMHRAALGFVMPLRMAEGFSEQAFDDLLAAIRHFHSTWTASDTLPKAGVLVLIDLPRMVEACSTYYDGQERQRIAGASMQLADVILEGF